MPIQSILKLPSVTPEMLDSLTMHIKSSHYGNISRQLVYASSSILQKRVRDQDVRLGKTTPLTSGLQTRTFVVEQEWNGRWILPMTPEHARRCKEPRLGWHLQGNDSVQGLWTMIESQNSINWRELKAIDFSLQAFQHLAQRHSSDIHGQHHGKAYVNHQSGTKSRTLNTLATSIATSLSSFTVIIVTTVTTAIVVD